MFWTHSRGHGRRDVTQRQGTFPEQANFRPTCVGFGGAAELDKELRDYLIAQFCRRCPRPSPRRRKAKASLLRLNLGLPVFAVLAETLGELLKFVVNSLLPVGPLRQQH
jgi:hypothetical protein